MQLLCFQKLRLAETKFFHSNQTSCQTPMVKFDAKITVGLLHSTTSMLHRYFNYQKHCNVCCVKGVRLLRVFLLPPYLLDTFLKLTVDKNLPSIELVNQKLIYSFTSLSSILNTTTRLSTM
jgi:hypothetical protein